MSDGEQNNREPIGMDTELFEMLDHDLREIFKQRAHNGKAEGWDSDWAAHANAAAQTAQALMQLHRDFKPGN